VIVKRYISAIVVALFTAGLGGALQPTWAKDLVRVGEGPYISGGGLFIARDKGYFDKMGIDVAVKPFIDATLAVPSLIAGELDVAFQGAAANLFNGIAKGAPLVIFLDRGNNRVGRAYTVSAVTLSLYDQGIRTVADLPKLKGKRIGVSGVGSINQYSLSLALIKGGINPAKDVEWVVNVAQPDLMRMLGQGQLDAIGAAYNIAVFAQENRWGRIVGTDDEVAPGGQIGIYVVDKKFLAQRRDVIVRWTMAYLQGVREFDAAATAPDKHPDIVEILAKNTSLNKPELVKAIAPHWAYVSENGEPNVASVMAMQDFWSGPYFQFVEKKLSPEQLFDLTVAKEARERLDRDKPFGP
jgi:NitT/TauT family transport system substrate-binding protein